MEMEPVDLSCIEGPQSCKVPSAEWVELHVGQNTGWVVYMENSQTLSVLEETMSQDFEK